MTIVQKKLGIWSADTANVVGSLHAIADLDFQYLAARVVEHSKTGPTIPYKPVAFARVLHEASIINFPVVAWAYVYPHLDISEQIQVISSCLLPGCPDLILDGLVELRTE